MGAGGPGFEEFFGLLEGVGGVGSGFEEVLLELVAFGGVFAMKFGGVLGDAAVEAFVFPPEGVVDLVFGADEVEGLVDVHGFVE